MSILTFTEVSQNEHQSASQMKGNLSHASVEPLLNYFEHLIPLNKEEKDLVTGKFHPRLFRKRPVCVAGRRSVQSILFRM